MNPFQKLQFREEDQWEKELISTDKSGTDLLTKALSQSPSITGQVFSCEDALFFQWKAQSIPLYSREQTLLFQRLRQGWGVFLSLSSLGKKDFQGSFYFFQESTGVGHWEVQCLPVHRQVMAKILEQTEATLREPSHQFLFSFGGSGKGFAYSLGYYPTEQEEKEGYDRSAQGTFRLYGEKFNLLLRVIPEEQCLRVVRVEERKEQIFHPLSLAKGSFRLSQEKNIATDSALQLVKEREGAEYIKLWDRYAQAEGALLLEKIRHVGEIVFTAYPQRRTTEQGTFEYVGQLQDPLQGERLAHVKEVQGTLLLSTEPPNHLDPQVSWTAYSEKRREGRGLFRITNRAVGSVQEQEEQERKTLLFRQIRLGLSTTSIDQRCQFTLHPWNNTLVMSHEKNTPLHFGHYPDSPVTDGTNQHPEKEKQGEEPQEPLPKIYITLDLGGDATGIKRRNQARYRMLDGASANPRMAKVMEGKQTALPVPQEILDPLTLDGVMHQCFPNGATPSQRKAVDIAINTPDIALIQGPPGTGKTTVITAVIEAIQQELRDTQRKAGEILITSYQHDAVDYVQKKILTGSLPPVKFQGKERGEGETAVDLWCKDWKERFLTKHQDILSQNPMEKVQERYGQYERNPSDEEGKSFLDYALSLAKEPLLQEKIHSLLQVSPVEQDQEIMASLLRKLRTTKEGFLDDGVDRAKDVVYALCGPYHHEKGRERREQGRKQCPFLFQSLTITGSTLTPQFLLHYGREKKRLLLACTSPSTGRAINPQIQEIYQLLEKECQRYEAPTHTTAETAVLQELFQQVQGQSKKSLRDMMSRYTLVYGATLQHSVAAPMAKAKLGSGSRSYMEEGISFDTVIVDEAARANPMDLMIAITQGRRRLILVGDHRQLPQVYDEELLERLQEEDDISLGLDQSKESMFQYLMSMAKKLESKDGIPRSLTLQEQFRMHPLLGEFIHKQFYEKHQESFTSPLPETAFSQTLEPVPLVWRSIPIGQGRGKGGQVRSHNSMKREGEAKCIVETLCSYLEQAPSYSVGVISFYNGQKKEILSRIQEKQREFPHLAKYLEQVEVGTVDSFQGKEFDLIFLSLVRSQPPKLSVKEKGRLAEALERWQSDTIPKADTETDGESDGEADGEAETESDGETSPESDGESVTETDGESAPDTSPEISSTLLAQYLEGYEEEGTVLSVGREQGIAKASPPSNTPEESPEESASFLERLARKTYGFLTMENRLCVALSRQKRLLVVVGNETIYGADPLWRGLAQYAVPSLVALYELSEQEGKVCGYGSSSRETSL